MCEVPFEKCLFDLISINIISTLYDYMVYAEDVLRKENKGNGFDACIEQMLGKGLIEKRMHKGKMYYSITTSGET